MRVHAGIATAVAVQPLYLVPRSVVHDTRPHAEFEDSAKFASSPYARMKGHQTGTTSANSDVLQMAYVFDLLTSAEATAVRDALLRNASGVENKTLLTWTSADWSTAGSPYLTGLPVEVLQSVPLLEWRTSPSHPENVDVAPPALPFWVRLVLGDPAAIAETLDWIRSGLVWVANLAIQFLEALRNFGSWLGDMTSGDPVRMANAVQAAQKAFDAFVQSIIAAMRQVIDSILAPLMRPILDAYRSWIGEVASVHASSMRESSPEQAAANIAASIFGSLFFVVILIIGGAITVLETVIAIFENLIPAAKAAGIAIRQMIWQALVTAVEQIVLFDITVTLGVLLAFLLPPQDPIWALTGEFGWAALSLLTFFGLYLYARFLNPARNNPAVNFLTGDTIGLALTLTGFFLALGLQEFRVQPDIAALIALVIAAIGMVIGLGTNSFTDRIGLVGLVDEAVDGAAFGFTFGAAITEWADTSNG